MKRLYTILFLLVFVCSFSVHARKLTTIVVDGTKNHILYGYKENELCHPASLTKKMTLYIIFEALAHKIITMKTKFRVSSHAAAQPPCKLGVRAGEYVDVSTIIKSLVTRSANDIAVVIAEGLKGSVPTFARYMNEKARQLGMNKTKFYNPSGLPDKRQVSTARDMAALGIALYRDFPQYARYFKIQSFRYRGHLIKSHNHLLSKFKGLDGIKTGYTNASGFNISTSAVRYDKNGRPRRVFAVVMGGDTRHARDRKATEILEVGFDRIGIPMQNMWQPPRVQSIEDVIRAAPKTKPVPKKYKPARTQKILSIAKKIKKKRGSKPILQKVASVKKATKKKSASSKSSPKKTAPQKRNQKKAIVRKASPKKRVKFIKTSVKSKKSKKRR